MPRIILDISKKECVEQFKKTIYEYCKSEEHPIFIQLHVIDKTGIYSPTLWSGMYRDADTDVSNGTTLIENIDGIVNYLIRGTCRQIAFWRTQIDDLDNQFQVNINISK